MINNEDEIAKGDVAALLQYWFTIDGTQLRFTDGIVAYEGKRISYGVYLFHPEVERGGSRKVDY